MCVKEDVMVDAVRVDDTGEILLQEMSNMKPMEREAFIDEWSRAD